MSKDTIREIALRTIGLESEAIRGLGALLDDDFERVVTALYHQKGRLVISGVGKSALIAQKIVATLNSTGTPAIFLHAGDAIHGDLGMVQADDIVMLISKSGNSPEIKWLVPLIKNFGNTLIGMVGNRESYLALQSNLVLDTTVDQEACPNNLAPTTSTTAQLVMGDAIAVCLMELRGFTGEDFAKFHPGGTLGKKLYLRVSDLYGQNERPLVRPDSSLKEVILEISQKRLGVTAVLEGEDILAGVITDGDLRRMLEHTASLEGVLAKDIMTGAPKTIGPDALAVEALDRMRNFDISQLIVTDDNNRYLGVLQLHDLVREGLI
ncbi:MAG TPA: KpsF/GutQ family sugar-phosphate isomerase [Dinghuibacter sp.]|jgi:arabinose-5-phosphate isomerase|uniref:KpsF/GutQ family sugar-phosphate isomerase n=1 Tax=Dinghuibacter sp. TaxID=2024697 RepID=UPI002C47B46B|nr:KpsF/GutQ family sugar-phosphate isomerase [Dinghuibacter sp.]HTJ13373.1 KpsF/GutQ family sugar-phosphate isomerase [Dinghuibacter sp.]